MTPRSGLYVALVGLVVTGLCFSILGFHAVVEDRVPNDNAPALVGVVLLDLGLAIGLIVMALGLVMAGVLAMTKQRNKPS
jgi:hypothetical protein